MSSDIRKIISSKLSAQEIESLDGAPVLDPEFLDEAIVRVVYNFNKEAVAVYSMEKLIELFAEHEFSSSDDPTLCAESWIDFNVMRTIPYMGSRQPQIVYIEDEEPED